ncbi:MAG: BamA/TamA family outer membrane protein [Planctomycetaceae bacterium]|nr:BamA/TamA family outer membrane protein [Planctomycetaceae bacterium]
MRRAPVFLLLLGLAACGSSELPSPTDPDELIVFEGVSAVSTSELLELVSRDLERHDDTAAPGALEDAAYRIQYRYRLAGYDRVTVTSRQQGKKLIFRVDEGARLLLAQVHFDGATVFKSDELSRLVPSRFLGTLPPYSQRAVTLMEESIVAAYRDRGYLDIAVTHRTAVQEGWKDRMVVWFRIQEGNPHLVTEIRGLPSDTALEEKTRVFLGKPYTPGTPEALEASIVDFYRENGHPFATARVKQKVDHPTGSVALEVELRQGPHAAIQQATISGAVWTRERFILERAGLKRGEEYRMSDLRHAEERLMATAIFKRVRVSPSPTPEETVTLPVEIEVEEREGGEASLRGGYGSFEGPRLGADLTGVNIWGGAESLRVGGNISKTGYRGDTELGVPYLFGTDLRLGLSAYYESREYPSFDAISRGGVVSFSYPFFEMFTGTVGVRHANIITSNVDPSVPPGDLLDFNYTALFVSPTLDLRDNPLNPTRGMLLTAEVAYTPSAALSDIQFWSASGRFSYFFSFPGSIVFATSFQGGVIGPFGETNEIPIALREFAGGTNTVRGFKFESIGPKVNGEPTGGQVFLALQSEIRVPLVGDLQGAVFSDQGGVWFDRTRVDLADIRYSVGVGLRFVTPAGALAADVGWNPHTLQGEHPVEFHLSVGFPF